MNIGNIVIACVVCFLLGVIVVLCTFSRYESSDKKRRNQSQTSEQIESEPLQKKFNNKKIGTMNLILIILGVSILAFVIKMIQLFELYGAVPDTLITCFFAAVTGEISIMGLIKNSNNKHLDRKWQLEDRAWENRTKTEADDHTRNDL